MKKSTVSQGLGAAVLALGVALSAPSAFASENYAEAVAALGGDAEKGERVFKKCQACHFLDQEKRRTGPHLVGIFGRTAGATEDFKYSKAMTDAAEDNPATEEAGDPLVWNVETLSGYLTNPRKYIKGNKMAFAGIKDEGDLADLLAHIYATAGETPAE